MSGANLRQLLFGLAVAALLLAALILSAGGGSGRRSLETQRARPIAAPTRVPSPSAPAPRALRRRAERFLNAFLSYEVGSAGAAVRRDLRATATPSFAAELLQRPPRPPATPLAPARLERLSTMVTALHPPAALVSGSARRGGGVEQYSFLFLRTASGWRASGPGE